MFAGREDQTCDRPHTRPTRPALTFMLTFELLYLMENTFFLLFFIPTLIYIYYSQICIFGLAVCFVMPCPDLTFSQIGR